MYQVGGLWGVGGCDSSARPGKPHKAHAEGRCQRSSEEFIHQVMPRCSEFLIKCWWRGKLRNCTELFKVTFLNHFPLLVSFPLSQVRKTDEGFCCSFNTVEQSQNLDISLILGPQGQGAAPGVAGQVGQVRLKNLPSSYFPVPNGTLHTS